MKRFISAMLFFVIVVFSVSVFVSCDENEKDTVITTTANVTTVETTTEATTEATTAETTSALPDGYTLYDNGDFSFAYPETWTKTDGSVTILVDGGTGNNVTIVYEALTDVYQNMTSESFKTQFQPVFEASGMSVSGVAVDHRKANGVDVTVIKYSAIKAGTAMTQTLNCFNVGNKTYTVTVTLAKEDPSVWNTFLESLRVAK